MPEVFDTLKAKHGINGLKLVLTDLYPNREMASRINHESDGSITYLTESVNAANLDSGKQGVRTMVGSFHHMKPEIAHSILKNAKESRQPICIFEISDNSIPIWLWWITIPMNFLMVFFITPLARPLTWQQLVFTYLIPVIPLCFAWDGAVSNARTYTLTDMDELLIGLETADYRWEKGSVGTKLKKLYLLGLPVGKAYGKE